MLIEDARIPLISATGSTRMGRIVAETVGRRLGRTLLELGGNNGVIVMDDANLDLALRAVLFGAVGTAGQRCTTIRRLFLQRGIAERFTEMLKAAYAQVRVGDPMDEATLMGPLIDRDAVHHMMQRVRCNPGTGRGSDLAAETNWAAASCEPAIVALAHGMPILREEVFAPILYVIEFDTLDEVIAWHNDVPQGLSSAMFTNHLSRPRLSSARAAATAASPTSTSAPAAPRSAARSAAKRTPAADASPAAMRGRPTCGARPLR